MLSLSSVVVASPQQTSAELADETVVLALKDGVYYGLDPISSRIWTLVQERRTVASVCDTLLAEYDGVDAEQCGREVLALLEQFREWGLLEVESHE